MTNARRGTEPVRRALIVAITSDIGTAIAARLLSDGWQVSGTFRTESPVNRELAAKGVTLVRCDLKDSQSRKEAAAALVERGAWDAAILGAGTLEPIGSFSDVDFADWEESINANLLGPLHLLQLILAGARSESTSSVIFFAGGGTNSAPPRFSAYTVSKIALIKMCELLDAEMADIKFTILGPGWVKTKIHAETLAAKERAGAAYDQTLAMMAGGNWVPIERVVDCCVWALAAPKAAVGGRNFSVAHDAWGAPEMTARLIQEPDMYKLRRAGNDATIAALEGQPS